MNAPTTLRRSTTAILGLSLVAAMGAGCNQYEMFRLAGFAQEDFSNDAEILFVMDNSSSMLQESAALATNFDVFIKDLTNPAGSDSELDGLSRAVDDYILSVSDRGGVIDFQIGITSTDVGADYGRLYGYSGESILKKSTVDVADKFRQNLLCEATCFQGANGGLGSAEGVEQLQPGYTCGDPLGDTLHFEYMNCLCDDLDSWKGNCGSGREEGLEGAFLALCRTLDPADTSETTKALLDECEDKTPFTRETDGGSNAGFLRESGSIIIPVIVTDEGDGSRRIQDGTGIPTEYESLYAQFGRRMAWAVIGPANNDPEQCPDAPSWARERYSYFVDKTDGLYVHIGDKADDDTCQVADFRQAMSELGKLLNSLLDIFPLQAIPDIETIEVYVDGKEVDQAEETRDEDTGEITYASGWVYLASENAVRFYGDAIPDYGAKVRIYYRPLEGMPRSLPF